MKCASHVGITTFFGMLIIGASFLSAHPAWAWRAEGYPYNKPKPSGDVTEDVKEIEQPKEFPPQAKTVVDFLKTMGKVGETVAKRFEDDFNNRRISWGVIRDINGKPSTARAETGPATTIFTDPKYNKMKINQDMLTLISPKQKLNDTLVGWAATIVHEYTHMDQTNPKETPEFENKAWNDTLAEVQRWMIVKIRDIDRLKSQADSPDKATGLAEDARYLSIFRNILGENVNSILDEKIPNGMVSKEGPWTNVELTLGGDIKETNTDDARMVRQIIVQSYEAEEIALDEALATQQRLGLKEGSESVKKLMRERDGAEKRSRERYTFLDWSQSRNARTHSAAGAAQKQSNGVSASCSDASKDPDVIELRQIATSLESAAKRVQSESSNISRADASAQGDAAVMQSLASTLGDANQMMALANKVETLNARVTKKYTKECLQSLADADKAAVQDPNRKQQPESANATGSGIVKNKDGSRVELTTEKDSSGKNVKVWTTYDRTGKVVDRSKEYREHSQPVNP